MEFVDFSFIVLVSTQVPGAGGASAVATTLGAIRAEGQGLVPLSSPRRWRHRRRAKSGTSPSRQRMLLNDVEDSLTHSHKYTQRKSLSRLIEKTLSCLHLPHLFLILRKWNLLLIHPVVLYHSSSQLGNQLLVQAILTYIKIITS